MMYPPSLKPFMMRPTISREAPTISASPWPKASDRSELAQGVERLAILTLYLEIVGDRLNVWSVHQSKSSSRMTSWPRMHTHCPLASKTLREDLRERDEHRLLHIFMVNTDFMQRLTYLKFLAIPYAWYLHKFCRMSGQRQKNLRLFGVDAALARSTAGCQHAARARHEQLGGKRGRQFNTPYKLHRWQSHADDESCVLARCGFRSLIPCGPSIFVKLAP